MKCRPGYKHPWYLQRAFQYNGNMFGIGGVAQFEDGYVGEAFSDIITSYYEITHKFHFNACGASHRYVYLPSKASINSFVNNAVVIFDIEIVCDRSMPNKIRVQPETTTDGYIYGYNGQTISYYDMAKGDVLRLRYYNGGWHVLSIHS